MSDESLASIPLYHGTSSIFLPSILQHGLGAQDPHDDLQTRDFLAAIVEIGGERLTIEHMVNQDVTAGGFNFRHGNTYLSPSLSTAVHYALVNPYGSELLSNALRTVHRLRSFDPAAAEALAKRYPAVVELVPQCDDPLLIEVSHIPAKRLRSERGGDAQAVLEGIQELSRRHDEKIVRILLQQHNFELIGVVPPDQLTCYRIRCDQEDPSGLGYSLERM